MTLDDLERDYAAFVDSGGVGSAELYRLSRYAGEVAAERRGPLRIIAYMLKTILFDLALRADDRPITPGEGTVFFRAIDGPVRAAITALRRPATAEPAIRLADRLLDATDGLLR
jgi:hypothetical protein